MFPLTQISNIINYFFYKEIKCQNPSCNRIIVVPKDNIVTHCSVSCGYNEYNQHCQSQKLKKEEIELQKREEIELKEKEKREEIKKSIYDEIYKEELEKMKNELKEEIRNDIKKKLELEKDILKNEILNN